MLQLHFCFKKVNHYSLLRLHYLPFLFLIMWQFRYPVLLWTNKSGATPIIKYLCQENCVNQMLRADNSCPKMNNMAVRKKKYFFGTVIQQDVCVHTTAVWQRHVLQDHVQLCGISKHHQPYICRHNDLSSCRLDCSVGCSAELHS